MPAAKTKMSITVSNYLAHLIETTAKATSTSKSELIEKALKLWHEKCLEEDAKKMAAMELDDPTIEKAWIEADLDLSNEWEWKE